MTQLARPVADSGSGGATENAILERQHRTAGVENAGKASMDRQ